MRRASTSRSTSGAACARTAGATRRGTRAGSWRCIAMKFLFLAGLGLGIGCLGGMVGIGGGVLLIPALTELFKVEPRKAAGMTLAAMVPPVTLPGAWRYYNQGFLLPADLGLAACI